MKSEVLFEGFVEFGNDRSTQPTVLHLKRSGQDERTTIALIAHSLEGFSIALPNQSVDPSHGGWVVSGKYEIYYGIAIGTLSRGIYLGSNSYRNRIDTD